MLLSQTEEGELINTRFTILTMLLVSMLAVLVGVFIVLVANIDVSQGGAAVAFGVIATVIGALVNNMSTAVTTFFKDKNDESIAKNSKETN